MRKHNGYVNAVRALFPELHLDKGSFVTSMHHYFSPSDPFRIPSFFQSIDFHLMLYLRFKNRSVAPESIFRELCPHTWIRPPRLFKLVFSISFKDFIHESMLIRSCCRSVFRYDVLFYIVQLFINLDV